MCIYNCAENTEGILLTEGHVSNFGRVEIFNDFTILPQVSKLNLIDLFRYYSFTVVGRANCIITNYRFC